MHKMPPNASGFHQGLRAITAATKEITAMLDSWETVAVISASAADMRRTVREAQQIIDQQASETNRAYRQLSAARRQNKALVAERTARHRMMCMEYLTRH